MAVVLKKNNDKASFIVMPLTSAKNGAGVNKVDVGEMDCLPASLKKSKDDDKEQVQALELQIKKRARCST